MPQIAKFCDVKVFLKKNVLVFVFLCFCLHTYIFSLYFCLIFNVKIIFSNQEEVVRQPPNVMAPEQVQYYFHLSQLQSNAAAAAGTANSTATPGVATANTPQITHLPPGAHVIQQNGQFIIATPQQLSGLQTAGATPAQTANVSSRSP